MLQHGESVMQHFLNLNVILREIHMVPNPAPWRLDGYKFPTWFVAYRKQLLDSIADYGTISYLYCKYHDCGKPWCEFIGSTGKKTFPNHAAISWGIWTNIDIDDRFPEPDHERIGELIKRDMDIHLLKPEGVKEFSQFKDAPTLLLSGLAEIHANAEMFGGIKSSGFKIKWAQIERRGNAVCKELWG